MFDGVGSAVEPCAFLMVAPVHPESASRTTSPVCLWRENPNRLVSLWDIVEFFNAWGLHEALRRLEVLGNKLKSAPHSILNAKQKALTFSALGFAGDQLKKAKFDELAEKSARNQFTVAYNTVTTSSVSTLLLELYEDAMKALMNGKFVLVDPDCLEYTKDRLFGDSVHEAFRSARTEISEAGNCMAVGLSTAAVYHLMRVAERGARAFLIHEGRQDANKRPLDLASWEDLLVEIESIEESKQSLRRDLGRQAEFDFYHGIGMELRALKNKFRNPSMHTRVTYDKYEARAHGYMFCPL